MRKIFFIFLCFTLSCYSFGQVKAILIDKITKEPIAFATVYDSITKNGTHSDEKGYFTLKCQGSVLISHILYEMQLIPCSKVGDSVFLIPKEFVLSPIEITSKRNKEKIKKSEIIKLGVWNGISKMQYEGIKEAALFIENPIRKPCLVNKVFFSFSNVKFDDDGVGTIKDKDILLSIQIYNRSKLTSEPALQLLRQQLTYRLKAGDTKVSIDLLNKKVFFPSEGGFVAVEFLGYFEEENFIPTDFNNVDIKKQFSPDLSGKHLNKNSFYRKTFSNEWDMVNVDFEGFFNFNFGIEIILSGDY